MSKNKRDYIAIAVAIILIAVYIFYECYSVTHIELETQTALATVEYETIDATALVVRDEQIISNVSSGVTVPCFSDGDKINVGGNVAMTFSSNEKAADYAKLREIRKELEYYKNLESQTVGQAGNVASVNDEIDNNINNYIRAVNSGDYKYSQQEAENVNDSLLRRQLIIGEKIDLLSIIQSLRQQNDKYSVSAKPDRFITTDKSGVFSSYTDGFESIVDYSQVTNLTQADVENALSKVSESGEARNNLGKLITSYNWYFLCVVDSDSVKTLKDGQNINLTLKSNGETVLRAQIITGAEPDANSEKTVLVLRCNTLDASLASLRKEEIEIRLKSYKGIRAPSSAVHIVDGKKGIYALISSQVRFREARILYSKDDYVILSYKDGIEDEEEKKAKEDDNIPDINDQICLYDKIITQGKDLEDGKVYT